MINRYLIVGGLIVVFALGAATRIMYLKNEALAAELALQTQRAEALESSIVRLYQDQKSFNSLKLELTNKLAKSERALETSRGREGVVIAKPTLISLRINKVVQAREKSLACLTGDFSLCEE